MRWVKRLFGDTKTAILAAGALAAAVVAVYGAVKTIFFSPTPPGILADIEDVTLETNVALGEYEARDQTADLRAPGSRVPAAPTGYQLAAYTTPTGYRLAANTTPNRYQPATHIASTRYRLAAYTIAADSTGPANGASETETSPSTSTPETPPSTTPGQTTPTPTTTYPEIHKPKSEKATKKTKRTRESLDSGAHESTRAYKRTKLTETTTPESTAAEGGSEAAGVPFVKPPPSETAFKSEGATQTLNGTGASTSEVDGVLAEAANVSTSYEASPPTPKSGVSPSKEESLPSTEATARIALPRHCGSSCGAGPTVDKILADNSSPAQAAKEVATVFRHSRGRYFDHELHPLGADVEYTLKLTGFVHNDAILEWTLWSQSENRALPHSWWQGVIVKQVKPSRYEETVSGTFWAPLPPRPGDYTFHLAVYDEQGNRRGHVRTPVFH
jgi:hypothetical protein